VTTMMEEEGKGAGADAAPAADPKAIKVNIADALNEQELVKFTVHTQTDLERFAKKDFEVTRLHEEFVWLFDRFTENDAMAGYIIPPPPPKPDFSVSHLKLIKLHHGDQSMPSEEVAKLKSEIQSEYLAAFQKTVAMHEVFLVRLTSHPVLREDQNLQVFLEYDQDLSYKKKSKAGGYLGRMKDAALALVDGSSLQKHVDEDAFFEGQKSFIYHYLRMIKDAQDASVSKVGTRKQLVNLVEKVGISLTHFANTQHAHHTMSEIVRKTGESHVVAKTHQNKLAAKEDLKMTDLLKYYRADSMAARDLMERRVKALNTMKQTELALATARQKGKKVLEAQDAATAAKDRYESITKSARDELKVYKKRRIAAFRKGLIQYTQSQIRQSREMYGLMKTTLAALKDISRPSAST